jgi:hypothetical protein
MRTYTAQFSNGEYGTLWFDAETKEEAQELLQKVRDLDLLFEHLPNLFTKTKGDEFEIDGLEEVNE